jgi:hypothetical protein
LLDVVGVGLIDRLLLIPGKGSADIGLGKKRAREDK